MNNSKHLLIILIAVAFGTGSFVATYAWPPSTSPSPSPEAVGATNPCANLKDCKCIALWLRLSPEETEKMASEGASFFKERPKLESALYAERRKLADLFENEDVSDKDILEQVERVIAVNSSLERCVASYLVGLRHHLTDEQRGRLYRRCAKGVRDAGGCRWQYRDSQSGCGGCGSAEKHGDHEKNGKKGGCGKAIINRSIPCEEPTTRPACRKRQQMSEDI